MFKWTLCKNYGGSGADAPIFKRKIAAKSHYKINFIFSLKMSFEEWPSWMEGCFWRCGEDLYILKKVRETTQQRIFYSNLSLCKTPSKTWKMYGNVHTVKDWKLVEKKKKKKVMKRNCFRPGSFRCSIRYTDTVPGRALLHSRLVRLGWGQCRTALDCIALSCIPGLLNVFRCIT